MKYEKSCGAICFTVQDGEPRVLVIRHRYGGHWAFPKGHVEPGETERQTARREVREETGVQVRLLNGYRESVVYSPARGVSKKVVFFVAEIIGGTLKPQPEEVCVAKLLPYDEALSRITFAADKALLEKAKPFIFGQEPDAEKNIKNLEKKG
jgi:8-oxo-dGTP pyrophosphatase MutT (NUDIX family)